MKNLSVKLDDNIFNETEEFVAKLGKNRNRYINEAIHFYNNVQKRSLLFEQLRLDSKLVREESMKVLRQFERLEIKN